MADIEDIRSAAERYCVALHKGDADGLAGVFLPESHICGVDGNGALVDWPLVAFLDRARSRGAQDGDPDHVIRSVGITGDMAIVCLEVAIAPRRFADQLNFLKTGGEWRIISKAFTVIDGPAI